MRIEPAPDSDPTEPGAPPDARSEAEQATDPEGELAAAHDRLAALLASNLEYRAVNEELQSANEALLASREEFQSINGELRLVNGELAERLAEFARAGDDAAALLRSLQLAVLLLDGGGRVKSVTPRAAELFGLLREGADDVATVAGLGARLSYPDLEADLGGVLLTSLPAERRLRLAGGRRCVARMLPHRSGEGAMVGVVLALLEIGLV